MPSSADKSAIQEANVAFSAAFEAQDACAVLALYEDDAIVLPPDGGVLTGGDAIQDWYTTAFGMGIAWLELFTDALRSVSETMLVEQGRYRIGQSEDSVVDAGSYTVYWRQIDGNWKVSRHVIVSSGLH